MIQAIITHGYAQGIIMIFMTAGVLAEKSLRIIFKRLLQTSYAVI